MTYHLDRATLARRQAGSTFKPFVYAAALNQGWSSGSPIEDSPLTISGKDGKPWNPHNYSGRYYGQTTLGDALTHSLNSATVRLMQVIGYKEVHRIAKNAGLGPKLPANLSFALGATEVSILQMTVACAGGDHGGYRQGGGGAGGEWRQDRDHR